MKRFVMVLLVILAVLSMATAALAERPPIVVEGGRGIRALERPPIVVE